MSDPSKDPTERMRLLQGDRVYLEDRIEIMERRVRSLSLFLFLLGVAFIVVALRIGK